MGSISGEAPESAAGASCALDYQRVERAIAYLHRHAATQPELAEVARHVHLSEFHFQRLFMRWAGVSPKRFLQHLTLERAKQRIARAGSLLEVSAGAGLSGPGRLHDLFVTLEAMSPGEYKSGGAGLEITFGVHESPFGWGLIASTARGICALRFLEGSEYALETSWFLASLRIIRPKRFSTTWRGTRPLRKPGGRRIQPWIFRPSLRAKAGR